MDHTTRTFTLTSAILAEHAGEQMLFLAEDGHLLGRTFALSAERPACYTLLSARGPGAWDSRVVRLGPVARRKGASVTFDGSALTIHADAPPDSDSAPAPSPQSSLVSTVASVAVVAVAGPLMQRGSAPGPCAEYVAGYDTIAESYCAAHAGPADSVAMTFDTPGGVVAGLFSALAVMQEARAASGKMTVGHIGPQCGSAGYAIASACCDTLVISDGGYAGSIGCRGGAYNKSEANAKAGVSFQGWGWPPPPKGEEASGKLANHPDMPPTALGNARGSRDIADMGQKFGELVAASRGDRGLDMAAILGLHADMLRGQAAVDAGLADMVGEESAALSLAMAHAVERRSSTVAKAPPPDDGDDDDDDEDEERDDALPPVPPPPAARAHQTGDRMKFAQFASLVGLGADASEPTILAAMTPVLSLAKATLKASGTTDPEDAKAWIKQAGAALAAEPERVKALADASARSERAERFHLGDELVAKGHRPGDVFLYGVEGESESNPGKRVRVGMVDEYAAPKVVKGEEIGMSLGTLRGFVRRAPTMTGGAVETRTPFDPPPSPRVNHGSVSATDPAVIAAANRVGVKPEEMAAARNQMDLAMAGGVQ